MEVVVVNLLGVRELQRNAERLNGLLASIDERLARIEEKLGIGDGDVVE